MEARMNELSKLRNKSCVELALADWSGIAAALENFVYYYNLLFNGCYRLLE